MATTAERSPGGLKARIQPLLDFWQKVNNDWVLNLSGMLAYNFLMSIFPILLVLLAIAGFVLGAVSPEAQAAFQRGLANALPGGAQGNGGQIVNAALANLRRTAGLIFVVGLLTAIFTGSRLFISIESAFGVIFRLRARDPLRQNLMAIGMLLLFVVLIPIVFLASIVPNAIVTSLFPFGDGGLTAVLIWAAGIVAGLLAAAVLFGSIYVVVPNRPVPWREVWKGTLAAAVLLVLYELLFPLYQSVFLKPSNYGSVAGFAIVILVFFYYLAFILLLGAEVNSWAQGQRQTAAPIDAILHEVQAHNTTRGAAGPTAGTPQEDIQHGKGAEAMESAPEAVRHERDDHHFDMKPPEYAEAGREGAGPAQARPRTPEEARAEEHAERSVEGGRKKQSDRHDRPPTRGTPSQAHTPQPPRRGEQREVAGHRQAAIATPAGREPALGGLPRRRGTSPVVGALATAGLSLSMWLLGRRRPRLPA